MVNNMELISITILIIVTIYTIFRLNKSNIKTCIHCNSAVLHKDIRWELTYVYDGLWSGYEYHGKCPICNVVSWSKLS